jgi:WD40 repeat protein
VTFLRKVFRYPATTMPSPTVETLRECARCGGALPPSRQGRVCPRCLSAALQGAAPALEPAGPVLGKFGEYELLSVAGRGGMGVVYRARHARLGREVALKMVASPVLAGESAARRFRAEVEAMAGLDHAHLIPVYECGEVDGQAYYTMKIVEGGHLSSRLKDGEWPMTERVRLLVKVARAVDYAHRHGVLHRDLKPSNIMVDAEGEPYVCDFGLARRLEGESSLTVSGAALGTPEYMAPEQAGGQSGSVTTAADVYSMGAILYEMLAGRPPFRGGTALETMRQVMEQEPVSPSTVVRTTDRDLETIALKCLAKEPARRYASAVALADDLDRWLRHEPITARRPRASERLAKWLRRHPALAAGLALCLAGAGAFIWQQWREEQRVKSERDRAEAGWASARARHYAADMDAVADALERGDFGVAAAKLEAHRSAADRGLEWSIYERALAGEQVRLLQAGAPVRQLAWSADGTMLAAANTLEVVTLWKAADGTPLGTLPDRTVPNEWDLSAWKARDAARRLRFQPNQSGPALLSLVGINPTKGGPHTTSAPAAYGISFSPDGTLLATADNDGTKFWRLKDRWIYDWLPGHAGRGIFLDNNRYLVAEERSPYDLGIFDLTTGHWQVLRTGAGGFLATTPDRRVAATVHRSEQRLRVFSLPDGAVLSEWADEAFAQTSHIVLLPGTDRFLLRSTALPRVVEGDWRERRWVRSLGEGLYGDTPLFAVKDDRHLLAITDQEQRVRLHQMSDGVMLAQLRGKRSPLLSMQWSPDNQTLATGEEDGSVRLWQPERHRVSWEVADGKLDGALYLSARSNMALGRSARGISTVNLDSGAVAVIHEGAHAVPAGWDGGRALFVEKVAAGQGPLALRAWEDGKVSTLTELADTAPWSFGGGDHAQLAGTRWVILGNGGRRELRIFDRVSGACVWQEYSEWHPLSPAVSPDGGRMALASEDRRLRMLDWPAGTLRRSVTALSPLLSLAWTPDGTLLAAGCRDGTIRLYDAVTLEAVAVLSGHASGVWGLQFSADGRRLVSASEDSRVRLWDMGTRQPLGRLPAGVLAPRSLGGFTAGDRAIAAGLWGGMLLVWRGN